MTVVDDLVADLDAINDRAELVAFLAPLKAPNNPPDSERTPDPRRGSRAKPLLEREGL
jgi:hypothetical protein